MSEIVNAYKRARRLAMLEKAQALVESGMTLGAAAKQLGISRMTIYKAQGEMLSEREGIKASPPPNGKDLMERLMRDPLLD